ncbi:LysR family transcriptional regulator [Pseudoalteromonas denitrificans]|uniref:Regulatory helix-turn-helix protein, lysR family n=1 Tax=Pseudoalteromonas denitrificans DSM 6059 TaxID=1123010 RepID=A0A1I1N3R3_9GAMM|nr:LysR family transcriptional regulator [Pseudoalteromonas denitrificans]SFC88440.1 regulatory helix-turn-helix protein, lysR family [Pseudoalteromonas denitrificans DSM 6059]
MLDTIDLFIKVNRYNTFHEAAVKLNIPLATLQRRIKKLEDNLALALFYRERGCLRLTEPGKQFYTQCLSPVENLQNVLDNFKGHSHNKKGSIKLIAPQNFMKSEFVNGLFKDFSHRFPEIKIHMVLSDERLDLKNTEFDLAVRIGKLVNSQNICKVINRMDFVLAAAPELIAELGSPNTFTDLAKLPHITFTPFKNWKFLDHDGQYCVFHPEPNFIANDFEMCALAALEGRGVYYGPLLYLKKHLKNGELITLLNDFQPIKRDINLIWPDKLIPHSTRLLIDYLSEKLSEPYI